MLSFNFFRRMSEVLKAEILRSFDVDYCAETVSENMWKAKSVVIEHANYQVHSILVIDFIQVKEIPTFFEIKQIVYFCKR